MPWNSTFPLGSVSVRANRTIGQQNTTYLETILKNDHYFNEDVSKDGYHKKASMPNYGSTPGVPAGTDGVYYVFTNGSEKESRFTNDGNASFHLNIWTQQLRGTFTLTDTSTNINIATIPSNAVGQIIMFRRNASPFVVQTGQFASDNVAAPNNTVHGFSNTLVLSGTNYSRDEPLILNNNPNNPNVLRVRPSSNTYANLEYEYLINYRII